MLAEPSVALSPRQERTLQLLLKKMSNKEIGCALGISERTVKFHLANIYRKCGIHDRHVVTELVRDGSGDSGATIEMPARNDGKGLVDPSAAARENSSASVSPHRLRSAN